MTPAEKAAHVLDAAERVMRLVAEHGGAPGDDADGIEHGRYVSAGQRARTRRRRVLTDLGESVRADLDRYSDPED